MADKKWRLQILYGFKSTLIIIISAFVSNDNNAATTPILAVFSHTRALLSSSNISSLFEFVIHNDSEEVEVCGDRLEAVAEVGSQVRAKHVSIACFTTNADECSVKVGTQLYQTWKLVRLQCSRRR